MPIIKRYDPSFALLGEIGATIGAQRVAAQQAQQQQAAMARMQAMEMQQQGALERQAAGFEQQKELMGLRTQAQSAAATQAEQRAKRRAEYESMLQQQGYEKRLSTRQEAERKRYEAARERIWKKFPGPQNKAQRDRALDAIDYKESGLKPEYMKPKPKIGTHTDPETGRTIWTYDGKPWKIMDPITDQAGIAATKQAEARRDAISRAANKRIVEWQTTNPGKNISAEMLQEIWADSTRIYDSSPFAGTPTPTAPGAPGAGATPPAPGSLPPIDPTKPIKSSESFPPIYEQQDENGNWRRVSPPASRSGQLHEESDRTPRGQAPPADAPPPVSPIPTDLSQQVDYYNDQITEAGRAIQTARTAQEEREARRHLKELQYKRTESKRLLKVDRLSRAVDSRQRLQENLQAHETKFGKSEDMTKAIKRTNKELKKLGLELEGARDTGPLTGGAPLPEEPRSGSATRWQIAQKKLDDRRLRIKEHGRFGLIEDDTVRKKVSGESRDLLRQIKTMEKQKRSRGEIEQVRAKLIKLMTSHGVPVTKKDWIATLAEKGPTFNPWLSRPGTKPGDPYDEGAVYGEVGRSPGTEEASTMMAVPQEDAETARREADISRQVESEKKAAAMEEEFEHELRGEKTKAQEESERTLKRLQDQLEEASHEYRGLEKELMAPRSADPDWKPGSKQFRERGYLIRLMAGLRENIKKEEKALSRFEKQRKNSRGGVR